MKRRIFKSGLAPEIEGVRHVVVFPGVGLATIIPLLMQQ